MEEKLGLKRSTKKNLLLNKDFPITYMTTFAQTSEEIETGIDKAKVNNMFPLPQWNKGFLCPCSFL